ncbi:MAG: peptide-methionine (S)-S-oxide reductase MsrA [Bacteroidota bacterium]
MQDNLAVATFGAGCFWCVEAVFQQLEGVHHVISGYEGGQTKRPTYREICSGLTGHAEVIQVHYDPAVISFDTLVEVFFTTHDPTTLNRQGADRGTQYRSVIFYHDKAQETTARRLKAEFAPQYWNDPIVTEISATQTFYPAEDYHQNYYNDNGMQPYCRIVIDPKLRKARQLYSHLMKATA